MASPSGRRICVACLLVALGALAVDRMVLSKPASGPPPTLSANEVGRAHDDAPGQAGADAQPVGTGASAPSDRGRGGEDQDVATRLRGLAAKEGARPGELADLVETFLAAPPARDAEASAAPTIEIEPPMVTAVLVGDRPAAIAGGRQVALGATLDGWTVLEISRSGVVFGRDGVRAERRVR